MRPLFLIFVSVLLLDWLLGALCVNHLLPLELIPILNFPFGLPHYWLSLHWDKTGYLVNGQRVREDWDLVSWGAMVVLQSLTYWGLWRWHQHRKTSRPSPAHP